MRRMTVFVGLVIAGALVLGACKKKDKPAATKGDKLAATKPDKKPDKPAVMTFDKAARDRIVKNTKYTKKPYYKEIVAEIPKLAATCQKAKKYVSSLTWCDDWKTFKKKLDKDVFKNMQGTEPKTVRKAMAVVAAAAKNINDESLFVRYTALETINWALYYMTHAKVDNKMRTDIRRLLAWVYKHDKTKDMRKKSIDILGNDGGVIGFRGDAQDARVLFFAAEKDADKWVRQTALSELAGCVKAGSVKCPLQPDMLRKWQGKEKDKSNTQYIAKLAGKMKMAKEVITWCKPFITDGTLYWGCKDGLKNVIGKDNFAAFKKISDDFIASPVSKKSGDYRTGYLAEIMVASIKNGAPKDKVMAWLEKVLKQPETVTMRGASLATTIVRAMTKAAQSKDEVKNTKKLLKARLKAFKKAWGKDKSKKSYLKVFEDSITKLKAKKA